MEDTDQEGGWPVTNFTLRCRECGKIHEDPRSWVCDDCFGPIGIQYDFGEVDRKTIEKGPKSLWRYEDFLPLGKGARKVDLGAGCTPLRKAENLGRLLGLKELYLKDDSVNPTFSFKDRPAAVAVSKAIELGFRGVGCASTGNLAAATAAHAAKAGLPCFVFVPDSIERAKIAQTLAYGARVLEVSGNYDDVNRLVTQAADGANIAFVNVNIRPYYVEGSKTLAFETCEDLGWQAPDHVIVPAASGALLCSIQRGFKEFQEADLIPPSYIRISAAQPEGCSPIVDALQTSSDVEPIATPRTVAHSLAIGSPADGNPAAEIVRKTRGLGLSASDGEILEAINILAKTEGVLTEPAGGTVIAALRKGVEKGNIDRDEVVVAYITGNGLKAPQALAKGVCSTKVGSSLEDLFVILGEASLEAESAASVGTSALAGQ